MSFRIGTDKVSHFPAFLDLLRSDAMFFVVFKLLFAPTVGFVDGFLHTVRDAVGIHDSLAMYVAGRPAYGLCERAVRTQETLFVCIQDSY